MSPSPIYPPLSSIGVVGGVSSAYIDSRVDDVVRIDGSLLDTTTEM